ncbi:tyrosine-protein phosphatase [Flagellimonas meridianipacifica]|uniref:protein-tyrosine-phosphatase n=1 Tax=Flagellimonas meridianipacifica TaxID=1080225 RepID=A0A2T0MCQ3_9FLAO|nr:CpsB/CapC family capsule biosynthesis tyrosine phosphatase [Allomuricauda pacifica]PRX55281.1 tyrosine-protein phosphatase YwqE [Allomuricauda pacifica]
MFQIFIKKEFLVDHLDGFVDIHNHILPGIDDGAKTVEESIRLIREFSEFGVNDFICTPHIMNNYYENTPSTVKDAFNKLKTGLVNQEFSRVSIDYAAEHMIDDNFETLLKNGMVVPLAKDYLLVEMSYLQASINFDTSIKKITSSRFFPILAHPERYIYLHQRLQDYKAYKNNGILFQLNLLSLSPYYGDQVQKTAYKLLEEGMIDFVASDAHNVNQIKQIKELKVPVKMMNTIRGLLENTKTHFSSVLD